MGDMQTGPRFRAQRGRGFHRGAPGMGSHSRRVYSRTVQSTLNDDVLILNESALLGSRRGSRNPGDMERRYGFRQGYPPSSHFSASDDEPWASISGLQHMSPSESPGGPWEEAYPIGLQRWWLPEQMMPAQTIDPEIRSLGIISMIIPGNVVPISLFIPGSGVLPPAAPIWVPQEDPMSQYLEISPEPASGASPRGVMGPLEPVESSGKQSPDSADFMQMEEYMMIDDAMTLDESVYHNMHQEMHLDVDTMSYEELLGLEEQIGNVSAGLTEDTVRKNLKRTKYPSSAAYMTESCCICQEDYANGDDLGVLTCGHDFHASCVGRWLVLKNNCPICKKTGLFT